MGRAVRGRRRVDMKGGGRTVQGFQGEEKNFVVRAAPKAEAGAAGKRRCAAGLPCDADKRKSIRALGFS